MADMKKAMYAIVGVVVAALLVVNVAPMILGGGGVMGGTFNESVDHTEGESVEVYGPLEANATDIDSTNSQVTLELTGSDGATTTTTVSAGSTQTVTVDSTDLNVTVDTIDSDTSATVTYEGPEDYGTGAGGSLLQILLPLVFVIGAILWIFKFVE